MALFAVGSSVTMVLGPWLWLPLNGSQARVGSVQWGAPQKTAQKPHMRQRDPPGGQLDTE